MRSRYLLAAVLFVAACENVATTDLGTPPVPPSEQIPPIETTVQTLADCTPVELWRVEAQTYGWIPAQAQFSPNGGLVTRGDAIYFGGTSYFRVSDGAHVASVEEDFSSRDRRWERGVRWNFETVIAETLFDGSVLFERPFTDGVTSAVMTKNGERMAILMCTETTSELEVYTLPQAARSTIALPEACEQYWGDAGVRMIAVDDTQILVATKTRVHQVDLVSGAIKSSPSLSTLPPEARAIAGIVSFNFDAKTGNLAVVTGDPRLVTLSGTDLSQRSATEVPLVTVNQNIYAPLVYASPVAWSPDGRLFAHLDMNNDLVLDKKDGEIIHARIPPIMAMPPWGGEEQLEIAASVSFSPDGKLMAVAYEHAFSLFGCEAVKVVELPRIAVRLEGPDRAKVGEVVRFLATDLEGRDFHGHQFLVDGTPVGVASEKRELEWTPETAGKHTISVSIDDGLRRGDASLEVIVE